jgi:hypothetical protein
MAKCFEIMSCDNLGTKQWALLRDGRCSIPLRAGTRSGRCPPSRKDQKISPAASCGRAGLIRDRLCARLILRLSFQLLMAHFTAYATVDENAAFRAALELLGDNVFRSRTQNHDLPACLNNLSSAWGIEICSGTPRLSQVT